MVEFEGEKISDIWFDSVKKTINNNNVILMDNKSKFRLRTAQLINYLGNYYQKNEHLTL